MDKKTTAEPQYSVVMDVRESDGTTKLGIMSNQAWHADPKRLAFTFSRYKFVAKMLSGYGNVLEVGCADAFATRIVLQEVESVTAVDFDPIFIDDVKQRHSKTWPIDAYVHDMVKEPFGGTYDAAFSMDVLEHIEKSEEDAFLRHINESLGPGGVAIYGMPSLESQAYASPVSKAGHVNCKTGPDFKKTLERHFDHVFLFSMNDEVVHTGYTPMAQYLIGLCVNPK